MSTVCIVLVYISRNINRANFSMHKGQHCRYATRAGRMEKHQRWFVIRLAKQYAINRTECDKQQLWCPRCKWTQQHFGGNKLDKHIPKYAAKHLGAGDEDKEAILPQVSSPTADQRSHSLSGLSDKWLQDDWCPEPLSHPSLSSLRFLGALRIRAESCNCRRYGYSYKPSIILSLKRLYFYIRLHT